MNPLYPLLAFSMLLPICRHSMASDAVPTAIPAPKPETPRQAIEQFLGLTAIWMLEMEWTHAYANKTPKAEDFRNAMLAAGLQQCPADFQEAWLRQTARPGRNYAAPVLRKYGVSLKDLRERLQGKLFKINPRVHPPIPLYDEGEQIPRMDPRTCGDPKAILEALAALRAQVMGLTPAQLSQARQSIERVMLEFTLAYMETAICMDTAGIRGKPGQGTVRPHQNRRMPGRLPARLAARSAFLSQRPLHGAGADSLHRLQKIRSQRAGTLSQGATKNEGMGYPAAYAADAGRLPPGHAGNPGKHAGRQIENSLSACSAFREPSRISGQGHPSSPASIPSLYSQIPCSTINALQLLSSCSK